MTLAMRHISPLKAQEQPRARGTLVLSTKRMGCRTVLDGLRMSSALKALFPHRSHTEAILLNTSGGLTGGDSIDIAATAGTGSRLTLTTQAAERAYRAASDVARVTTRLSAEAGATLHWLPQELILYDGASLHRRLDVALEADARLLMVEPVIFGRTAMGERLSTGEFRDRIRVTRAGAPLYSDTTHLTGDIGATLARPAVAAGLGAMASVLYVAPDAEAQLAPVRALLPVTGGASLIADDTLALRLVAADGYDLRAALLPILDRLSGDSLPPCWRL